MAFFLKTLFYSITSNSFISKQSNMSQTIGLSELSEVRVCLDEIFKEVENRSSVEMVEISPEVQEENDDDWSTVYTDTDDEDGSETESEAEAESEKEDPMIVHKCTAEPIFAVPVGIVLGECAICYDEIKMINMTVTRCGHVFHASCVFESLEHRIDCPLCRAKLVNELFENVEDDA